MARLATLLTLSWRNLWRNRRRTAIMLGAITVGVWAMIFMTALMRGMVDDMLQSGIRNLPGHVQIQHPEYLDDPSIVHGIAAPAGELRAALDAASTAWAGRIRVPAMIASERETRGVQLVGIEPGVEGAISALPARIAAGRFLDGADDDGLIVGARLAERLETRLGKRVVVTSQDPDNNLAERGFRIVGLYTAETPAQEEARVYTGLATLQRLLASEGRVSQVVAVGADYRHVDALRERLRAAAPGELAVESWRQIDSYLAAMFSMMDGFVLVWVVIIFLALSFGLVNTLVMAIFERVREIGLLQALGMRPGFIVAQILVESLLMLLIGLAAGNALAVASVLPLEDGLDISVVAEGMAMMGAGAVLYPSLTLYDLALANGVVIVLGLLTGILPAWRAARLDPVRAINFH